MSIVIAIDSFKGSLTSMEAAEAVKAALLDYGMDNAITIPIADGGEGTVAAFLAGGRGEWIREEATDPLGRQIIAHYGWVEEDKIAIIECAAASGITLLKEEELDPWEATSYGTGQLMQAAIAKGARKIIVGLGGSAVIDGGMGMLEALGATFFDKEGSRLKPNGASLGKVASISLSGLPDVSIEVASDVTNPLLGEKGAVSFFGKQKGLKPEDRAAFERNMEHYARIVAGAVHKDCSGLIGSGAAGGLGFAFHSFFPSRFSSGFDLLAEKINLDGLIRNASLVITGEGRMDEQSLHGKVPGGIGKLAKRHGKPVVAFTGKVDIDANVAKREGIDAILPIVNGPMSLEEAMEHAPALLYEAACRMCQLMKLTFD
ncbi:glycerate kinase [Bacillus testis]|uniref:glycerate kinase n=1 Tax=Bacillus testis TaxID=1622072 RepID=UPI00067F2724|nr:glycerate kinase [Bacillus testis]